MQLFSFPSPACGGGQGGGTCRKRRIRGRQRDVVSAGDQRKPTLMPSMRAMVLDKLRTPLVMRERPVPVPGAGDILIEIAACGVCRTDLHVVDGELPDPKLPIVPGHEIVGCVAALGPGVTALSVGMRVGIPWLGQTCGRCRY